jgi:hypothetical protein
MPNRHVSKLAGSAIFASIDLAVKYDSGANAFFDQP